MTLTPEEIDILEAEQRAADLALVLDAEIDDDGRFYFYPDGPIKCGQRERDINALVAAGELHRCANCGCTELTPCAGGCIWATETLCSRCL